MEKRSLIEANRKAVEVLQRNREMGYLYAKAVRRYGEGELQLKILDFITQAFQQGKLEESVFSSWDSMLSLACGVWIQFLLVDVAGLQKEELNALAKKLFEEVRHQKGLH